MAKEDNYLEANQTDMFITGIPLKTPYGLVKPIKVKEYPLLAIDIHILKMYDFEVRASVKEQIKDNPTMSSVLEDLTSKPLIECIQTNTRGLREKYSDILSKLMIGFEGGKFFERFTSQKEWDDFRKMILDYNGISYIDWNPNPKIRYFQRLEIFYNQRTGKSVDFDAIYTSLITVGHKPHDINDFTLYQFYQAFHRLQAFKMYDTTTLYKTVDSKGTIEVIDWFKSSREKKEEKSYVSMDDLKKEKEQLNKN